MDATAAKRCCACRSDSAQASHERDIEIPQAAFRQKVGLSLASENALIESDLELGARSWHADCNRCAEQRKTFESKGDADRISRKEDMKPTLQTNERKNRRDSAETLRPVAFPMTDFQFQSGPFSDFSGRGGRNPRPSFRGISEEYFRTEARRYFAWEAAFFALIVLIAAVPVIEGLSGLVRFVYEGL